MTNTIQLGKNKKDRLDVILVVDDEDSEVYLCESILKYMYETGDKEVVVLTAYTSHSVQEILDRGVYIDLVLMDINLSASRLNGIELVKEIRSINGILPPPIVGMLTTSSREKDLEESIEAAADFYLEKTEDIYWFEKCLKAVKNFYLDTPRSVKLEDISTYFSYIRKD